MPDARSKLWKMASVTSDGVTTTLKEEGEVEMFANGGDNIFLVRGGGQRRPARFAIPQEIRSYDRQLGRGDGTLYIIVHGVALDVAWRGCC
jgi:hypothetical protein